MQTSGGTADTLHITNSLGLNNHRKLSQEKLSSNNTTSQRYHRSENDNKTEQLPTTRSCTCRKLLSRQTQIRRTCACGRNKNNQQSTDTAPKQYLENSTARTEDHHRQYCNNLNLPYPRIPLDTPYGDNNHLEQLEQLHRNPKMLDDGSSRKHENNNNNNNGSHDNNNGNNSSGEDNERQRGSQDDFNFEDIDLEASLYQEKVFYCLHRKSRWRHWAIRMTESPYPFHSNKITGQHITILWSMGL